jgi:hypothetical protein
VRAYTHCRIGHPRGVLLHRLHCVCLFRVPACVVDAPTAKTPPSVYNISLLGDAPTHAFKQQKKSRSRRATCERSAAKWVFDIYIAIHVNYTLVCMRLLTFFWRSGKFSLLVQDQQFIPGKMKSTDIWCVISWLIFLQRLLLNEFLYYSAATRRLLCVIRSNYSLGMRLILNI